MFNKFHVTFFDTKSVAIMLDIRYGRRQNEDIKVEEIKKFISLYNKIGYTAYKHIPDPP